MAKEAVLDRVLVGKNPSSSLASPLTPAWDLLNPGSLLTWEMGDGSCFSHRLKQLRLPGTMLSNGCFIHMSEGGAQLQADIIPPSTYIRNVAPVTPRPTTESKICWKCKCFEKSYKKKWESLQREKRRKAGKRIVHQTQSNLQLLLSEIH